MLVEQQRTYHTFYTAEYMRSLFQNAEDSSSG
jgi:hypothetical protein